MDFDQLIYSGFANMEVIEEQYQKYLVHPFQVDPSWSDLFNQLDAKSEKEKEDVITEEREEGISKKPITPSKESPVEHSVLFREKKEAPSIADIRIYNLIEAYRKYGHLIAKINPIATHEIEEPRVLQIESHGFTKQDLGQFFPTYGIIPEKAAPLLKIVDTLKKIYCGKIGVEYMDVNWTELEWLQQRIERNLPHVQLSISQKQNILQQLNEAELFESFLHTKYVGQKRFSLEGGETLIPILAAIIETGAELKMEEFVLGMAHRGRLNVLSNILKKSYTEIFSEFGEGYIPDSFEGSGDVKYHKGYFAEFNTAQGKKVKVFLAPNPSHLEAVDSVVEGQVRAKLTKLDDLNTKEHVLPIIIHGDASISGQGVVYETLQLYGLRGYSTGGTIHIVVNNQIGFTTLPRDARSTPYCTDIAKAFEAPVFHVNAEDLEGCIYMTNLAVEFRQKYHCDVFIDLNCYRKYGHNETDEPAFTQPLEYQLIRKKKSIRESYRDELINQGILEKFMAESLEVEFKKALLQAQKGIILKERKEPIEKVIEEKPLKKDVFKRIETGVAKEILQKTAELFCTIPEGFNIHPKLAHLMKERLSMVKEGDDRKPVDWGMAETLAYASLLWEGTSIRISGQDCCRGTFSQRHAMWMDQVIEKAYYPLQHLKADQGRFEVLNSPLSEFAILGFEYGYSLGNPESLVIWEAQFGDFCNGAQVIIDQFITVGEQKWGQKSGLVLYLPHGYEGQGPEHSSARIERFLSLSGHENVRIVNPTTPAQLFHLLRRQTLNPVCKPLIVFTPKGLLRHPDCISDLMDFTEGCFQSILDDPANLQDVQKIIFCSGRIFYDIQSERKKNQIKNLCIIRIEELYPLDKALLKSILDQYSSVEEYVWVQDEPSNMGAWDYIRPIMREILPEGKDIAYIGRARSASTAVGSHALHKREHSAIMNAIFSKYEVPVPGDDSGIKS